MLDTNIIVKINRISNFLDFDFSIPCDGPGNTKRITSEISQYELHIKIWQTIFVLSVMRISTTFQDQKLGLDN